MMKKQYATASTQEKLAVLCPWLEEHKARDLVSLDLSMHNSVTDALIVATAHSARHGQSLADGLAEVCARENYEFLHMEGYQNGEWILVDLNDIVVHIFQENVRELYRLESLWTAHAIPATPGTGVSA